MEAMRRLSLLLLAALSLSQIPWNAAVAGIPIQPIPVFDPLQPARVFDPQVREETFTDPIDGLSVTLPALTAEGLYVSGFDGAAWMPWEILERDDEQDPLSRESILVLFPKPVTRIRLQGANPDVTIHPIRISQEPLRTRMVIAGNWGEIFALAAPRILSRSEWGADESLGIINGKPASPTNGTEAREADNGIADSSQASTRVQACEEAQRIYTHEFRTVRSVTTDEDGNALLWRRDYAASTRLIVVHHTAVTVTGDSRSGVERMRALHQYHSKNKAWGDVGYHYIIDEEGRIYEGRAGGDHVVGGHAYCNNIGTVGVALMGNFEVEEPTQAQVKSLQWITDTLSRRYGIDLNRNVMFHGKVVPPVAGHRDLLSTSCPGYALFGVLDQVQQHVREGALEASVRFPPPRSSSSARSSTPAPYRPAPPREGLTALGDTSITARPGSSVVLAMRYVASDSSVRRGKSLGPIKRSYPRLNVSVAKGESYARARTTLQAPYAISAHETVTLRIKVQIPRERGTYTLTIGTVTYTIFAEGRRLPTDSRESTLQTYVPPPSSSRSSSTNNYKQQTSPSPTGGGARGEGIRIRLTDNRAAPLDFADISLSTPGLVNGTSMNAGMISLKKSGASCVALPPSPSGGGDGGEGNGIVRIDPQGSISTVTSMAKAQNRYRGILECRIVDGTLTLINELPLEEYMAGLAEEPDTEPWEKQRAFAVAARSYAAYYSDPVHRKFPGKPFDGSDNPAEFQVYGGVVFEKKNPQWVQAVKTTANQVLMKDGQVIRAPYFSSDDGRTRSPAEVGWANFPFAGVFASKPDPWCQGMALRGHGVGMSGCGARGQAYERKTYAEILQYYYPKTDISLLR